MNVLMLRKSLRDMRWTLFWYGLGLALYSLGILGAYPAVRDNAGRYEDILESYPESMLKAFGIEGGLSNAPAFLGAEFLNVIWPLIVSVFVVMSATAVVAQELERGTAELWLSVPERRSRLLAGKIVALLLGIAVLVLVTVAAIAVGVQLVDAELSAGSLLAVIPVLLGFPVAVAGYSVLLSSLMSERGKAAGLAGGLTLLFYLAWVFASLVGSVDWIRYLSIFTAYNPQRALQSGSVPWLEVLILCGIGLACFAAAIAVFERRDVIP